MKTTLPSRVREEMILHYGCPESLYENGGNYLRSAEVHAGKVILTTFDTFTVVSVGPESLGHCTDAIDPSKMATEDSLKALFPNLDLQYRMDAAVYPDGSTPGEFPLPDGYRFQAHDPSDHPLLESFLACCSAEDIDDAMIDLDDPDDAIVLVMKDDVPVTYAGYRIWKKNLGDVGILVLPEHRKQGLGVAAVAESTRICIERGYVPIYRNDHENVGSGAISGIVGFRRTYTVDSYEIG